MSDRLGKRVRIIDVDGMIWHGLPIKTGRPDLVGKGGIIIKDEDNGVPLIELDDGTLVEGCECWWVEESYWVEDTK